MSFYSNVAPPTIHMLKALAAWLEKAEVHAKSKNFEASVFLTARLAPDQYPLGRQIQAACDAAKFLLARLSGKEAPKHPDTETTYEEFKKRIESCLAFCESIKESDFAGADARIVPLSFMPGKGMKGVDYAFEMAIPNFYFHTAHAYAILRHNGVPLGKMDYISNVTLVDI